MRVARKAGGTNVEGGRGWRGEDRGEVEERGGTTAREMAAWPGGLVRVAAVRVVRTRAACLEAVGSAFGAS